VVISTHFPPPVITDSTAAREAITHMLCCSWGHILLGGGFLRECPGQHKFGLENGPCRFDPAVQGGAHPSERGVPKLPLDVRDDVTSIRLVPAPVKLLGGQTKLDDEVARQVLRFDLPALFPPLPQEGGLVVPHDDPGVRAADEIAAIG
jgi:hypothetical protein